MPFRLINASDINPVSKESLVAAGTHVWCTSCDQYGYISNATKRRPDLKKRCSVCNARKIIEVNND